MLFINIFIIVIVVLPIHLHLGISGTSKYSYISISFIISTLFELNIVHVMLVLIVFFYEYGSITQSNTFQTNVYI